MELRAFNKIKHQPILNEWTEKHEWPTIDLNSLPSVGMIAFESNNPIALGFLYDTDSNLSIIGWPMGDPDINHELRNQGIDLVMKGLILTAKNQGKKAIFTYTEHKRMIDRFKRFNFKEAENNLVNLIRSL